MAETIHISKKAVLIGLLGGLIASLWILVPLVAPGIGLIWQITFTVIVGAGIVYTMVSKEEYVQSYIVAGGTFLLFSLLIFPVLLQTLAGASDEVTASEGMKIVTLNMPGMACQGCVLTVTNTLRGMNGVQDVQVSLETKTATLVYDPKVITPEQMLQNPVIQGYGGSLKG